MRKLIEQWATAGDPNAMIKLATIYLEEGKSDDAKKFLVRAAEKNYRPAAVKLAKIFHEEGNLSEAVTFYKKATELGDVEAMDALVEICADDEEILDFVLKNIEKHYNDISNLDDLRHMLYLGAHIIDAANYTLSYAEAIERRRIRNKILQLKAKEA